MARISWRDAVARVSIWRTAGPIDEVGQQVDALVGQAWAQVVPQPARADASPAPGRSLSPSSPTVACYLLRLWQPQVVPEPGDRLVVRQPDGTEIGLVAGAVYPGWPWVTVEARSRASA